MGSVEAGMRVREWIELRSPLTELGRRSSMLKADWRMPCGCGCECRVVVVVVVVVVVCVCVCVRERDRGTLRPH